MPQVVARTAIPDFEEAGLAGQRDDLRGLAQEVVHGFELLGGWIARTARHADIWCSSAATAAAGGGGGWRGAGGGRSAAGLPNATDDATMIYADGKYGCLESASRRRGLRRDGPWAGDAAFAPGRELAGSGGPWNTRVT